MPTEIKSKRREFSKTFINKKESSFNTVIHGKPIHWHSKKGRGLNPLIDEWEEIDTDFEETDLYYRIKNHKFKVIINKSLDKKELIKISTDNGCFISQTIDSIKLNDTRLITPNKFKNIKRTDAEDKRLSNKFIDIEVDTENIIRFYAHERYNKWALIVNKNINYFQITTRLDLYNFKINNSYTESNGIKTYLLDNENTFEFESIKDKDDKILITQPKMWSDKNKQNSSSGINHTLKEIDGILYYTKEVSSEGIDWLIVNDYPYYIDTTCQIGGSGYDGTVTNTGSVAESWSSVKGEASGTASETVGTSIVAKSSYTVKTNVYGCQRGYVSFDTSSIGSTDTITAASIKVYGTAATGSDPINIYDWTGGQTITTADYSAVGSTAMSDTNTTLTADTLSTITLNATGIANIIKGAGAYSDFSFRDVTYDVGSSTPDSMYTESIYSFDDTGAYDPTLEVTTTSATVISESDGNRSGAIYLDSTKNIGSDNDKARNQYVKTWDFTSTDTKRNVKQKTKDFGT